MDAQPRAVRQWYSPLVSESRKWSAGWSAVGSTSKGFPATSRGNAPPLAWVLQKAQASRWLYQSKTRRGAWFSGS